LTIVYSKGCCICFCHRQAATALWKMATEKRMDNYLAMANSPFHVKVTSIDMSSGMVTFVDQQKQRVSVPPGLEVVYANTKRPVARVGEMFLVDLLEDYIIRMNGMVLASLERLCASASRATAMEACARA